MKDLIKIALAGNPNSGKTTIFNAITGLRHKVANYAGVTVEKKEGKKIYKDYELIIYDLPGVYSLTAYSIDEIVARDFILEEKPDIIIDVIDSTNIERNLYLLLQFQELDLPLIGALNISDQAEDMGIRIDEKLLSDILGIPLIKTIGTKGRGIEELLDKVIELYNSKERFSKKRVSYGMELETELNILQKLIEEDKNFIQTYPSRWLSIKLLEKDKNAREKLKHHNNREIIEKQLEKSIKKIEEHFGADSEIIISEQRYAYVHGACMEAVKRVEIRNRDITEQIDKILLNKFLGLPIFLFILYLIFQITFKIGAYPMGWLENFFSFISESVDAILPDGILKSLIIDGIIGGVGGVLSFVPLIIILFFCISILEDTGYMSRIAFIMDKFLHIFGLHGQSFLPMMIGFGCSVPAIMAARTLKNPKDRILTILIIPFMSCGAKLPVHILLAGAFFKENAANVVLFIYIIGVIISLISTKILRKILFKGEPTPFVMELPPYRIPTLKGIWFHIWDKTIKYIKKAGTVILVASLIIWAFTTFPLPKEGEDHLTNSIAGKIGRFIEPVLKPIGFNWKIGISVITGVAAKEVVVSTLSILYRTEDEGTLKDALRKDKEFNPLVAFVLMVFVLTISPCFATLSTVRLELGVKWLFFHLLQTTITAWGLSFIIFQTGRLIFKF